MNATYGTGHPTSEVAIGEGNTDVYEHFDKSLYQREARCSDVKKGGGGTFFMLELRGASHSGPIQVGLISSYATARRDSVPMFIISPIQCNAVKI